MCHENQSIFDLKIFINADSKTRMEEESKGILLKEEEVVMKY